MSETEIQLRNLEGQNEMLAEFILSKCNGYPNENKGAIETAIQIIKDYKSILELTKEMRFSQKKYFDTRRSEWLQKAKDLEKQIDAKLEEKLKQPDNQKALW